MKKTILNILIYLTMVGLASCQESRTVKVMVTEEDGTPIEGASTTVIYLGYHGEDTVRKKALTNAQGVSVTRGATTGRMHVDVEKEGYYTTRSGRLSREKDHDVTYVLRKKKNPIPLYARRFQVSVPVQNQNIGYDLAMGDWVAPHGKGMRSDVIYNLLFIKEDFWTTDYKLSVTFPNTRDGIQQFVRNGYSELQSPYLAPESGYQPKWVQSSVRKGKNSKTIRNTDFYRGHWMRVRTKVDDQGKIVSANYVKIYGDFPDIRYYFNPNPNDRNLEFNPKRGLFANLEPWDRANDP